MVLERLRRVTRDGRWIPEIDGLRFLAIMSVFMFHMGGELSKRSGHHFAPETGYLGAFHPFAHGDRGVRLFFIISGFVLALPFARQYLSGGTHVSLRKYFLRRVTRLEPPYILSVLIFLTLVWVYTRHISADMLRHGLASMFYLHNLIYGTMTHVNPVSWSLEVEIQFYLAAPLFMLMFRMPGKVQRRLIMGVLIVAISLGQFFVQGSPRSILSIVYYAQFFVMGLLLADIYVADGHRLRSFWYCDIAGLVGLVCMFDLPGAFVANQVVMPWAMSLLFVAALRGVIVRRFFSTSWVATIGGMCYSIYLMHFQFIAVFFKATRHCIVAGFGYWPNFLIQLIVTGVPVMLVSVGFFVLIERPCMDPNWPSKLKRWLAGRGRTTVTVPGEHAVAARNGVD